MKFILTIDIPDAIAGEVVPKEMEEMFLELAKHYKAKHEEGEILRHANVGIRDKSERISTYLRSLHIQGEEQ